MAGRPSARWISSSRWARVRLSGAVPGESQGPHVAARLGTTNGCHVAACSAAFGGTWGLSVGTTGKRSHARPGGVLGAVGVQLGCAMIARRSRAPTRGERSAIHRPAQPGSHKAVIASAGHAAPKWEGCGCRIPDSAALHPGYVWISLIARRSRALQGGDRLGRAVCLGEGFAAGAPLPHAGVQPPKRVWA